MDVEPIDGALAGAPGRVLYLSGALPPKPRLAVVGSRAAQRKYRDAIPEVVRGAVRAGFSVVSGGALGIDGDVHRAALDERVPQLAVLPLGADRVYPSDHAGLFRQIVATGHSGVIFAVPAGTVPGRFMFSSRNALVVGLCTHVLVAQAGIPSGTLGTGRLALRGGRAVGVLPGTMGAADLAGRGARVLTSAGADLADESAKWLRGGGVGPRIWPAYLAPLRRELDAAGPGGLRVDDLPDPLQGLVMLTEAETLGLVLARPDGRYIVV